MRVPQNIQYIIRQAIEMYRHYEEGEIRTFRMIRYIANRLYRDQAEAEAFYQHIRQQYQQFLHGLGLRLAGATDRGIRNIANTLGQMVTETQQAIAPQAQNLYERYIQPIEQTWEGSRNYMDQEILRGQYTRWTNSNNGQSFYEYLRDNLYFGERWIERNRDQIRSFLNSQGTAQAPIEVELNNQGMTRIVPHTEQRIDHAMRGIQTATDRVGGANQLAAGFAQGFNAPTQSLSTTTQAPTTTTAAPTTTTAAPERQVEISSLAVGGSGPTAGGQHGETGVDMINYTKFHPFKRVEQVLMPVYYASTLTLPANSTSAAGITFRLNSIYDIIHSTATFNVIDPNITPPTADTPDLSPGREVPMMREYWKSFYNYWHVIKCEWKFSYLPPILNQNTNVQSQLFFYEHGIQYPPLTQTVAGVAKLIPWHVRRYHPHVRQQTIYNMNMDSQMHNNWQTITGVWHPGDIQHEVAEDELTRVWHKFEQVPPTSEKLTILLQNMDGQPLDAGPYTLRYKMEMHYTVQLKDLKTQYEFITEETGTQAVGGFFQRSI